MPDHPKTVRRRILLFLYQRYQNDPLEMLAPEDFMDDGHIPRRALLSNIYYLHDRGLVELMIGYNPPMFAAARITADGIDLVENTFEFNLWFPEHPSQYEEAKQTVPRLIEQLVQEADFAPLDGERRKCLIAGAMVQQPEILFLDEPTANLDLQWREEIVDIVDSLAAEHSTTIVTVCHELEVLPRCCRRVVLLAGGRVLADGLVADVLTDERISSLYGRAMSVVSRSGRWAMLGAAEGA